MNVWLIGGVGLVLVILGVSLVSYGTVKAPAYETGTFAGVSLNVEYVRTPAEMEKGLGGRAEIPVDYGMLFIFKESGMHGFWMKDTLVPLDIFWLDDKRQVVAMFTDIATSTYPTVFEPAAPARFVLETAAGFRRIHEVATGTTLYLQSEPSVSE